VRVQILDAGIDYINENVCLSSYLFFWVFL
jgi:hypothetical protein